MVLESLLSPRVAEENPFYDFVYGVALTIASLAAAYFLFPGVASMLSVVLLSIGIVPVLLKLFYYEEGGKPGLLRLHLKALRFFLVFFLAVSLTVAALNAFLPSLGYGGIADKLFSEEIREIAAIKGAYSAGSFFSISGTAGSIIRNNLVVLVTSFLLSLLFGGGAAFVLVWNAMVFGIFLSMSLGKGLPNFLFSMTYALPELLAYYAGGLAGGLLSVELSSKIFSSRGKKAGLIARLKSSANSLLLLGAAAVLIILMGFFEAFLIGL